MKNETPFIVLTTGDPAGIGPEICLQAYLHFASNQRRRILLAGALEHLQKAASLVSFPFAFKPVQDPGDAEPGCREEVPILCVDTGHVEEGKESAEAGRVTLALLKKAVSFAMEKKGSVLVTAPINKQSLAMAGWKGGGHTELLAELTGVNNVETVFCLEKLKVFFLSRHMSLADAVAYVRKDRVEKAIHSIHRNMLQLGVEAPRIAIPGLNPHSGEGGLFGHEEESELRPAIQAARSTGIYVEGPIGADSVYHLGLEGQFDAILSLYHDQGHIALKTRDFFGTVTMTLGLPFLRTSVDHGTGLDRAWKGTASEKSLVRAMELALGSISSPGLNRH